MIQGILYIIATPIGNMADITYRAVNTLKEKIDYVYCEDTRQTRKILTFYDLDIPIKSLHAHSPDVKIDHAIKLLQKGNAIAYLTDSGTPGLSDPGSKLVRTVRSEGIPIMPIPGPSALSTIISVSGFPGKNIIFAGFLSKKDGKKRKELQNFKNFDGTLVIFESPKRIKKLITLIHEILPETEIVIGREITKMYEEFITGKIEEVFTNIDNIKEKGEFTVAIYNCRKKKSEMC